MTSLYALLGLPLDRALQILQREGRAPQVILTAPPAREGEKRAYSGVRCVVAARGEDTLIAADFKEALTDAGRVPEEVGGS